MTERRCDYTFVPNSNDSLPYRFFFRNPSESALEWATEQFGSPAVYPEGATRFPGPARGRWASWHNETFSFRDQVDAFAFRTRWG